MSIIQNIQAGDNIAVELLLVDGATDQYPQAKIYDQGNLLLTTVDMTHDQQGNYSGTYIMPNKEYIKIIYTVFLDAGHTTINDKYEMDIDIFYKSEPYNNIKKILGLVQKNFKIFDVVYTDGLRTQLKIKTYPTAVDLVADTNAIAEYLVDAVYDGKQKINRLSGGDCMISVATKGIIEDEIIKIFPLLFSTILDRKDRDITLDIEDREIEVKLCL